MTFLSPAKINVHLAVGNCRADGYHPICSWFLKVGLYDEIDVDIDVEESEIVVEGNTAVAVQDDLMAKAARLFYADAGLIPTCRIRIEKIIPVGAGLGGGSSNAATVLLALNHLYGELLSPGKLRELALHLGSDVPFFLGGPSAVVTGRGEIIEEVRARASWNVLIVDPGFSISTRDAYRWLDEERGEAAANEWKHGERGMDKEGLKKMIKGNPRNWCFFNDFSTVLYKRFWSLREICSGLLASGALHAGISGSGSACFGLFESAADTANAAKKCADMALWQKETLA